MEFMKKEYSEFIPRQAWGADPMFPQGLAPLKGPVNNVVTTWTDTEPCKTPAECRAAVKDIQRKHIEAGHADIKYNFLIGSDGRIYEGRGWNYLGPGYPETVEDHMILNGDYIEIAIIDRPCDRPSDQQLNTLSSVITDGQETNRLGGIFTYYTEQDGKISLFRTYDPVKDYELILPAGLKEQEMRKKLEEKKKEQTRVVPREELEYFHAK